MVNVTIDKLEESTITIFAMLCANALMNWTEVLYALKQPQKRHCIIGFSSVRHFTQFYETEFDMLKAKEIFSRFVSSKRWVSKWTNNISGSLFARFESERLRLLRESSTWVSRMLHVEKSIGRTWRHMFLTPSTIPEQFSSWKWKVSSHCRKVWSWLILMYLTFD